PFSVRFNSSGPNQNIWAQDLGTGNQSYKCWLDIKSRGRVLEIEAPDTVWAGETANIRVVVKDANNLPITATVCRFSVVKGHGDILEAALLTDTLGVVNGKFLCTRARFAEHDTVRISAGAVDSFIGIFVNIPDSVLMKGEIIAFPNPFGAAINQDAAEIYYYLNRSCPITVAIYDPFGNEVYSWRFKQGEPGAKSGVNRVIWNGRNRQGRRVASGIYVVQVVGEIHTGKTFSSTYRLGVVW
ncbi:MAG: FlgD immunoglobulin-like domain containing protein, partial [candidate division WOR-3 bacterium]